MRKRSYLAIGIVTLISLSMTAGCGSGSGNSVPSTSGTVATSALARDTTPQASDADLAAVVSGNTGFALKVFPLLDPDPNKNTFFSPYSITQAFLLLAPGAGGTTLSEIEQTLSFPLPQDRLNPAFNKLGLLIAGETDGSVLPNGLATPNLSNANAVWQQSGFPVLAGYLDTLAVNFGAGLHLVDFTGATEGSRQTINNWVAAQTNSEIQNLIPSGGISSATRLVLTNAIRFKADWAAPFSPDDTTIRTFTNRDGSSSSVPFLGKPLSAPYAYAQVAGCKAVELPSAGGNLSMLAIMPTPGTFDTFISGLTPAVVAKITGNLTVTNVILSLPKLLIG